MVKTKDYSYNEATGQYTCHICGQSSYGEFGVVNFMHKHSNPETFKLAREAEDNWNKLLEDVNRKFNEKGPNYHKK